MRLIPHFVYIVFVLISRYSSNRKTALKPSLKGLLKSQSAKYQIKVQGRLTDGWSDWFLDMKVKIEHITGGPAITILTGVVQDQAALHGLLNHIRDLGIPLLSVRLIYPPIIEKE